MKTKQFVQRFFQFLSLIHGLAMQAQNVVVVNPDFSQRVIAIGLALAIHIALGINRAAAAGPDRAFAQPYVSPAQSGPQLNFSGQSEVTPKEVLPYLRASEREFTAGWHWVWNQETVFAQKVIVYSGYFQNRLVAELHFWPNVNQLQYERQYVIEYGKGVNGDDLVTVEHYNSQDGKTDEFYSATRYVARVSDGKSYLLTVDSAGPNGSYSRHLDIQWTTNGVKAIITQGQAAQELVLNANRDWLPKMFDLWDDFGLRY